jgi:3',5'-cyclic-AMP phosphodiesterase
LIRAALWRFSWEVTMLIAQISDTHLKLPGRLAYRRVDTAQCLRDCVSALLILDPQPDLIVHTGDLVDFGYPKEYEHLRSLLAPLGLPILAIPGNHDAREPMRQAFAREDYLSQSGFLQFAVEHGPLRFVGLDTLVPGQGGGELCGERLAWLDTTLCEKPDLPTLVMMHHPPFLTGIAHMDRIGLAGRDRFAAVMGRHCQVQAILCGHVHRQIFATVGGRAAMICPGTSHQVSLDLRPEAPSAFCLEPPGYMLHRWQDGQLVSHTVVLGDWPGPFPFFDANGDLID